MFTRMYIYTYAHTCTKRALFCYSTMEVYWKCTNKTKLPHRTLSQRPSITRLCIDHNCKAKKYVEYTATHYCLKTFRNQDVDPINGYSNKPAMLIYWSCDPMIDHVVY